MTTAHFERIGLFRRSNPTRKSGGQLKQRDRWDEHEFKESGDFSSRLFKLPCYTTVTEDICPSQTLSGDAPPLHWRRDNLGSPHYFSLSSWALLRVEKLSRSIVYPTSSIAGNPDISLLYLLAIFLFLCHADSLQTSATLIASSVSRPGLPSSDWAFR